MNSRQSDEEPLVSVIALPLYPKTMDVQTWEGRRLVRMVDVAGNFSRQIKLK